MPALPELITETANQPCDAANRIVRRLKDDRERMPGDG